MFSLYIIMNLIYSIMKIKCLKNWNENCSAVLLTFVLFFLLVLLKFQGEAIKVTPDMLILSEIEIASVGK